MYYRALLAMPLFLALSAATPADAQTVTPGAAEPSARPLLALGSDSLYSRMRVLGLLPRASLGAIRLTTVDTVRSGSECPMPISRPDSTRQFAAARGQPLHSSDRMPTQPSACTNPLEAHR